MTSTAFNNNAAETGKLVSIHSLWQTDRDQAAALLADFYQKFRPSYEDHEMAGELDHFVTRMDRQNRMTVDGVKHGTGDHTNPTSVWTSIVVRADGDKVTEGVLTEIYPDSHAGVVTYLMNNSGSQALLDLADAETRSKTNKRAVDGVATEYNGESWEKRMDSYGETFFEAQRDSTPLPGFLQVPLSDHRMVPMVEPGKDDPNQGYEPGSLYVKTDENTRINQQLAKVMPFLRDYAGICLGEWVGDEADIAAKISESPYLKQAQQDMAPYETAAAYRPRGGKFGWGDRELKSL